MKLPPRYKKYLLYFFFFFFLMLIWFVTWVIEVDLELKKRVEGQWFVPPVEIYSAPLQIKVGQTLIPADLVQHLLDQGMRSRNAPLRLYPGDFAQWDKFQCEEFLKEIAPENLNGCISVRKISESIVLAFDNELRVIGTYVGEPPVSQPSVELDFHLFAQLYGGEPIIRQLIQIGDAPLYCLQAVTAIEDSDFLEHQGISPSGLFRALGKNILSGRYAQGGSTITQQLIKIYFLNSKKTLKRKFTELLMALLLEGEIEKDKILTHYLNAIYMGQSGSFQVVGFGAAAQHYFKKPLSELDLPQCALLAAMINSPGRFNPFTSPERAHQRRDLVLTRMKDLKMIDDRQHQSSVQSALPKEPPHVLKEPAPYFVEAVKKEMESLGIDSTSGLKIQTTLKENSQQKAQEIVSAHILQLESKIEKIKKLKDQGKELQALLLSVDVSSGGILALVGGRSFKKTQFNRAIEGHRQVGSVMKPFVYLAALESLTPQGQPYTPLTPVLDEPFQYKYQGQKWSPTNYEKKFLGAIPMFTALKNSINTATAQLGLQVGLKKIIDVAKRAGIQSPLEPLPSLTLGAFELYPTEVAESYLTLARFGSHLPIFKIQRIENFEGKILYETNDQPRQVFAPETVAVLVGMMKQTILAGTARSLAGRGFTAPAAGKTGTTSDTKDAWFVGFTPDVLTVVWVGYDDNTSHGLTGASGALPIWADYMKYESTKRQQKDFSWPDGTIVYPLSINKYNSMLREPENLNIEEFSLIFRAGEQPGL